MLTCEDYIIGCIMLDNSVLDDVQPILDIKDFQSNKAKYCYTEMLKMAVIDFPLLDKATKGQITEYIMGLSEVATAANVMHYVTEVKNISKERQLRQIAAEIPKSIGDIDLAIDNVLNSILSLQLTGGKNTVLHVKEKLSEVVDSLLNSDKRRGIGSYLRDLDKDMGNFEGGDITIIAARPSMGKTALALSMAYYQALNNHPVLFFSQEMTREKLTERLLCFETRVSLREMKTDILRYASRLTKAAGTLHDLPIYIDDIDSLTVTDILRRAKKAKKDHGIEAVYVDYLQLLKGTNTKVREQEIAEISRDLKRAARSVNLPFFVLAQLNRAVEARTKKIPMMSDLRESGAIEQDADNILMLYRDEYYNPESDEAGITRVLREKVRNGATGTTKVAFLKESILFTDLEDRYVR